MIDDLDRVNAQIDALELTLTTMDRLKPDCDVSEVVRAILDEVIDMLDGSLPGRTGVRLHRGGSRFGSRPTRSNPAAALDVVGEIASRLP